MKTFALSLFLSLNLALFGQSQALNELIFQIRNPDTNPSQFRGAIEKIGEYLALNILDELKTEEKSVQTLTGCDATHPLVVDSPVLVTILRAGLPLNAGVHKVFPNAEVGFLAMSRNEETLKAVVDYVAIPDLTDRSVIISDTMLATGGSMLDALEIVLKRNPKKIFLVTAIASQPGIDLIKQSYPEIKIFSGAVDPSLNEKGYIIPGLGDAGDRSYGKKHFNP